MDITVSLAVSGLLVLGGLVGVWTGYVAWQRRDHPAARPLAMISFLPGIGGFCYATLVFVHDPAVARVLIAVVNFIVYVAPGYFLLFALAYTGREGWITRRRRALILGVFAVNGLLSGLEPLVLSDVAIQTVNGLTMPVVQDTRLTSALVLVANYPGVLAGFGLLGQFLLAPRNIYRRQTLVISLAIMLTATGNLAFQLGLGLHPGLDTTIVFFSAQAVIILLALFRYEFLRLEPLAPEVVLEEMDDPVVVLDEDERIVDANPPADRLLGVDDATGTPVAAALPDLLAAAESDAEYVPQSVTGDRDSSGFPVFDANAAPIQDQYGRDRGAVVVLRDVTAQKERERTFAALQSATSRFLAADSREAVFEIAVETAERVLEYPYSGVMAYDGDEHVLRPAVFTDALEAAYEAQGADVDPVVGPGEGDVWTVFEAGEPRLGSPVEAADAEKIPIDPGGTLLFPLGDHGVLGISAGPEHDRFSDQERQFATILASTTENALDRVAQQHQLRESREQLARRKDQIEFFNSVLRHDMLNGMQVVGLHADLLQRETDGEVADHADTIADYASDLQELGETIRSVTDAVDADGNMMLSAVDPGPPLQRKVEKVREAHEAVTVELAVDPDTLPPVRADDLFDAILENVLGNAVEHNDTDAPRIRVSATVTDDRLELRVADNGPGVPDEMKEAVFTESTTSESSGSIGFGLYFVRTMLTHYGGDVWFEDRDATGPGEPALDATGGTTSATDQPTATDESGAVCVLSLPLAA